MKSSRGSYCRKNMYGTRCKPDVSYYTSFVVVAPLLPSHYVITFVVLLRLASSPFPPLTGFASVSFRTSIILNYIDETASILFSVSFMGFSQRHLHVAGHKEP
jgi:hypothetical protein